MNKNMQAVVACIQGLRNLDNWPESEIKSQLLDLRKSLEEKRYVLPESLRYRAKTILQYADPLGNEISLFEWCVAKESVNFHIDETQFELDGTNIRISTAWLGLNHSWHVNSKPIIFETMIFFDPKIENHELDRYQERHSTIQEAEEGHARAVALVQKYLQEKINAKPS